MCINTAVCYHNMFWVYLTSSILHDISLQLKLQCNRSHVYFYRSRDGLDTTINKTCALRWNKLLLLHHSKMSLWDQRCCKLTIPPWWSPSVPLLLSYSQSSGCSALIRKKQSLWSKERFWVKGTERESDASLINTESRWELFKIGQ